MKKLLLFSTIILLILLASLKGYCGSKTGGESDNQDIFEIISKALDRFCGDI